MRPFHYSLLVFLIFLTAGCISWWLDRLSGWWIIGLCAAFLHLLAFGAVCIRWNFFLKSHSRGNNPMLISLTFDDGPAGETVAILDILKKEQVTAAFFTIGKNAVQHPQTVLRWASEGHLIGNHSYEHGFHFDWKSAQGMVREIQQTNEVVARITGKMPGLFRPPYGVTNPNLAKAVRLTGMVSVGWNIRSFDTTAKDPEQLLHRILSKLNGGDIILLHDSMPVTRQILTELIHRAREKGFTFARLDELLQIPAYA